MAPIVVDPETLAGAGESVSSVGDEIAAAVSTLGAGLAGGAPTGLDGAGVAFGISRRSPTTSRPSSANSGDTRKGERSYCSS